MKTQIAVPISTSTFLTLAKFLEAHGSDRDPVEAVELAIHYWMDNADWKPEDLIPETVRSESRGYSWKYKDTHVFLPHGTELRMRYKDHYNYAHVEGDEILYKEQPVSPGALTKLITGSNRNAWKDIWLKLPDSKSWKLADDYRRETETMDAELDQLLLPNTSPVQGDEQ